MVREDYFCQYLLQFYVFTHLCRRLYLLAYLASRRTSSILLRLRRELLLSAANLAILDHRRPQNIFSRGGQNSVSARWLGYPMEEPHRVISLEYELNF